jgi:hypothetical protein
MLAVTAVWAALASSSPTRTYHFAPLLAALAWPVLARAGSGRRSAQESLGPVVGGFVGPGAAAVALALTDALEGPELFGGSALGEALILIAVGALWGLRILTRTHGGLLVAAVGREPADQPAP